MPERLAPARNPLDFGLDDALDQSRQIVVEPGFQHRPQHFLDQIFQRPRIVAEHGVGQRIEGGFDGRDGRARQDLLRRRRAFERRRFIGRLPMQRPGCGRFREFEIVLRFDLVERRRGGGAGAGGSGTAISSVSSNTSPSGCAGRISASGVASSRLASIASMSSWLLEAAGRRRGRRCGLWRGRCGLRARQSPTAECPSSRAWPAGRRVSGLAAAGGGLCGFFGTSRLGLVVGDDATDRRQNLLHRGLLDLCRLRHLRLHIETILHQASRDLPVPDMQAGIFIASA